MRRRLATLLGVPEETNLLDILANASLEWSGVAVGQPDFGESSHSIALTLRAGPGALHIIFNAYWEPLDFELPQLEAPLDGWRRIVDTSLDGPADLTEHVHRGRGRHDTVVPHRGTFHRDHGRPCPAWRQGEGGGAMTGAERARMADAGHPEEGWNEASPWYQWGPYLSERAWGSVREDYSADGDAWNSFPHDHARSRAYRWNEDGMAGLSDVFDRLCLGLSLWNGVDPILKERMFGLTNQEGNHGEDVKDYWWYLDALPSGAWLRWRYHYPQAPFPYEQLIEENARRSKFEPEYELLDTGVFDDDRYWIVEVHYAKADPTDILMRVVVRNQAPEEATLHVLPTLWFRNEWAVRPGDRQADDDGRGRRGTDPGQARHPRRLHARGRDRARRRRHPSLLFCENETNQPRIHGEPATTPYPKDGINDHVVSGAATVNSSSDRDEGRGLVRADGPGRWVGRGPAPAPPDRHARVIDRQGRGDQRLERQAQPTCSGSRSRR